MNISTDTLNKKRSYSARSMFSRASDETGLALIMALLLLVVIALLVPAAMKMVIPDTARTADYRESRRAFYIADAGIETAKSLIRYEVYDDFLAGPDQISTTDADNGVLFVFNTDGSTTLQGSTVSLSLNVDGDWEEASAGASGNYTKLAFAAGGGTYYARVYDNEDDTDLDDDSDYILLVHVVGVTDSGTQSSIRAAYRKYDIPEDELPGAVTMVGNLATITANGTFLVDGGRPAGAWDISGFKPGNQPATDPALDSDCPGKNALSVESATAATTWNGKEDSFMGITNFDDSDSIADIGYSQTDFTDDSAIDLRVEVKDYCTTCVVPDPPHTQSSDPQTALTGVYGSLAEPQITYVQGNLNFSGEGVGIMIVDGDLTIVGQPEWVGIILIGACPTCWGVLQGSGNIDIFGAMVVGNGAAGTTNFTGTANVWYSCEGISYANDVFSNTFRTVGWNEED